MNLRSSILTKILIVTAVFVASLQGVRAQGTSSLELTPSTNNPSPGQTITITAKSYSADIGSATVTWTAAGKTLAKGVGVSSVTIQAPALGKQTTVSVTAVYSGGISFSNSITIGSASVDMVIESGGFVPPTFAGKTSIAYQNNVKMVAVPHLANSAGVEYDPKNLIYKWEQSSKVLESESGYGKQSAVIPGNIIPRPYLITVTVTSSDGRSQGIGMTTVTPIAPKIVFYKDDPLYGTLYNNAVGSTIYMGKQREVAVLAVPYGFNAPSSGLGDLAVTWRINGVTHSELASNKSITLRAPEGSAGSSNVSLNINHKDDILEQASAAFSVIFSATN